MKVWRVVSFNMRLGFGLFVFLWASYFGLSVVTLNEGEWFSALLATFVGLFLCAVVAIGHLFLPSVKEASLPIMALDRTAPLLGFAAALCSLGVAVEFSSRSAHREFAREHAEALAGPSLKAVIYSEGSPDGGTAIIRSPAVNPESFSSDLSFDLVNGNIRSCDQIDESDWFCRFG